MHSPSKSKYNVVVIGSGNAGQAAASQLRDAGRTVAMVECHRLGGVCPNRGCVPKKVLVAAAETLDTMRRGSAHGIVAATPRLDWQRLIARKRELIAPLAEQIEHSMKERGVELYRGHAEFVSQNAVQVKNEVLEAERFVVATGSHPRPLPFEGAALLSNSDDFLEMDELPNSALFVGAGFIALEFAHVLIRSGVSVKLLETSDRPLSRFDSDAVDALMSYSKSLGIELSTNASPRSIHHASGGFKVQFEYQRQVHSEYAERVFHGAGRVAQLESLRLDRAGVTLEEGRVALQPSLRSTENQNLYFCGDALTNAPQLSPVATYEGRLAAHNLLHPETPQVADYSSVPSVVFTVPNLAKVGCTEREAQDRGIDYEVRVNEPQQWLSGRTYAEEVAYAKVLIDKKTERIIGAHLLGHGAADTIHVFSMAMRWNIPASELRAPLYAYPTFTNDVRYFA